MTSLKNKKSYNMQNAETVIDKACSCDQALSLWKALNDLTVTARTFRHVPAEDQQWTSIDDDALDQAFDVLEQWKPEEIGCGQPRQRENETSKQTVIDKAFDLLIEELEREIEELRQELVLVEGGVEERR